MMDPPPIPQPPTLQIEPTPQATASNLANNPPPLQQQPPPTIPTRISTWILTNLSTKEIIIIIATIILFPLAVWEHPDFIPTRRELVVGLVDFSYAAFIVYANLVLYENEEMNVVPLQKWLWGGMLEGEEVEEDTEEEGGLEGEEKGSVDNGTQAGSPSPRRTSPATPGRSVQTPDLQRTTNQDAAQTTAIQPFIVPPTPLLPCSMGPNDTPPRTPAQSHMSGLLGDSPMPTQTFKHFSGSGFQKRFKAHKAFKEWSQPGGEFGKVMKALEVLREEEEEGEREDGGDGSRNESGEVELWVDAGDRVGR